MRLCRCDLCRKGLPSARYVRRRLRTRDARRVLYRVREAEPVERAGKP